MATSSSSSSYAFYNSSSPSTSSSQRGVAMVLALISAVVLSPLYVDRKTDHKHHDAKWGSGFVLPMVLVGLIVAIKTTSKGSSTSCGSNTKALFASSNESSAVLRIGSSSWGLAAILVMLMLVMSWQSSMQHFLWR